MSKPSHFLVGRKRNSSQHFINSKTIFYFLRSHFSSFLFPAMNSLQDLSKIFLQFLLPCCFKNLKILKKFLGWENSLKLNFKMKTFQLIFEWIFFLQTFPNKLSEIQFEFIQNSKLWKLENFFIVFLLIFFIASINLIEFIRVFSGAN